MFSVVDAVLLRPLPFGEPERIVALRELTPQKDRFSTSDANLLDFMERATTLEGIAALSFTMPRPSLQQGGERVRLSGLAVTPSFFRVLGVPARLGRTFGPEEERALSGGERRSPRVAVLSYGTWQQRFGADELLVGREIDLDGEPWTVLGILPPGFRYLDDATDVYLPGRCSTRLRHSICECWRWSRCCCWRSVSSPVGLRRGARLGSIRWGRCATSRLGYRLSMKTRSLASHMVERAKSMNLLSSSIAS